MDNSKPRTAEAKPRQILDALAAGDVRTVLRVAASFQHLGKHKATITRGWAALQRPDFYRELGQNPDDLVAEGVAAVRARYITEAK